MEKHESMRDRSASESLFKQDQNNFIHTAPVNKKPSAEWDRKVSSVDLNKPNSDDRKQKIHNRVLFYLVQVTIIFIIDESVDYFTDLSFYC